MKPQLFYLITDPDGAAARKLVMELDLLRDFQFRNATYDEVRADLERLGGGALPALPSLWDGVTLHTGRDAVLAAIRARKA